MSAPVDGQAVSRPGATTLRPDGDRLPAGVLAAVVLAWVLLIAAACRGSHVLDHDALLGRGRVTWLGVVVFLLAWQVMAAAMMLPAAFPAIRRATTAGAGVGRFLAGFAAVWTAFAWGALSVDSTVHGLAAGAPWLVPRHVIAAGLFALVGLIELAPPTPRFLAACRSWSASGHATTSGSGSFADGLRYGGLCLGCDGALMLLAFGMGKGSVAWMGVLAVVMLLQRREGLHGSLHRWIGAGSLVVGGVLLVAGLV